MSFTIVTLTETGFPNLTPARIDLIGDRAGLVHHDYFQRLDLEVTDNTTTEALDLTGVATYHLLLKNSPSDLDADAIGSGSVTDTTDEEDGEITIHFPSAILTLANQGKLWWSLAGTTTTGSYVIPIAEGLFHLEESSLTAVSS